jgi:hypothetical protein
MEQTMHFVLVRIDEGVDENIEFRFDCSDMDIHQTLKKFADFLLAVSYSPEAIQMGFDAFDIEAV